MRPDISPAMQAAFESGEFREARLFALHFSTPVYLTDNSYAITIGPNTYLPVQGEMKIPDLATTLENKKGSVTISLPNTDRVFDALIQAEGFADKWINIGSFFWDKDDNELGYIEEWGGTTTKPITDDKSIKITAASYHSIFEKRNGIKTTPVSHSKMFSDSGERDLNVTFWWAATARKFKVGG
jgi:hypothetical protein